MKFPLSIVLTILLLAAWGADSQGVTPDDGTRPPWTVVEQKIQSHALVGFEWVDQAAQ